MYFANNYRYVKYEVKREESTKKMMLLTDFTRLPTYIKISSGLWRRVVNCFLFAVKFCVGGLLQIAVSWASCMNLKFECRGLVYLYHLFVCMHI